MRPQFAHRRRVVEALALLAIAWFCIRFLPFRFTALLLGRPMPVPAFPMTDPAADTSGRAQATAIRAALISAASRLPWTSTCLMRALAGRLMLRRRRLPSLTFLGLRTPRGPEEDPAHAWLLSLGIDITGGAIAGDYKPLAMFIAEPIRTHKSG
nr:lasso peptide biosynthesis B2 protein [Rhodospirillum rubrum]